MTSKVRFGAALAVGCFAAPAFGQFFEMVASESVVELVNGSARVTVSMYMDRDGSTDGYYADFANWHLYEGAFGLRGVGAWVAPTETTADDSDGTWFGRRPSADPLLGQVDYGSFRYPYLTIEYGVYTEQEASSVTGVGGGGWDSILARRYTDGTARSILGFVTSPPAGSPHPDTSDRLEVFRAEIEFTQTGVCEVGYLSDIWPAFNITPGGFDIRQVDGPFYNATITVIPAPGVLALLAPALCVRRRRA